MKPSDKSNEIVDNFYKYIKNGDRTLIESYSVEELKQAKYQYHENSNREFYKAIEDRIKEIEDIKAQRRTTKEKWMDRLFGFIAGISVALASIYFKWLLEISKKNN